MIVQKRGKGVVRYHHNYRYIKRSGSGFFDFLKPVVNIVKGIVAHKDTISKVINTGKDLYKVGQNTKDIIESIRKPKHKLPITSKPDDLQNIIDRINGLKTGSGFAYV